MLHHTKNNQLQAYEERLKIMATQLSLAEEKERRAIAADLHDHLGHSLALARIQLESLKETTSALEKNILVNDISKILLKAMQETKCLIFDLTSPVMNNTGLGPAISDWLEEHIARRFNLKIEIVDNIRPEHQKKLGDNLQALLFRSVRELLTNVVKHARAEMVKVHLNENSNGIGIIVEDNGAGFDPPRANEQKGETAGFGLFSIQERMIALGGSFNIRSEPGMGCRVELTVPEDPFF
jgi:signal transduction histidine kinase